MPIAISDDAQAYLSTLPAEEANYIVNNHTEGDRLTSGEAQRWHETYQGIDPYGSINAIVDPNATKPGDLLGISGDLMESTGVNAAQAGVNTATQNLTDADNAQAALQQSIGDRTVSMSKITGIQRSAADKFSLARESLTDELGIAQTALGQSLDQYNLEFGIVYENVQQTKQLILNNPGAGIKMGDSLETQAAKLDADFNRTEIERKQEVRENATRDIFVQVMGYVPKAGMSEKEMQKKMKKESKSAAKKAEERADEAWELETAYTQAQIANLGGSGGGSSDTKWDRIYDKNGNTLGFDDGHGNVVSASGEVISSVEHGVDNSGFKTGGGDVQSILNGLPSSNSNVLTNIAAGASSSDAGSKFGDWWTGVWNK